MRNEKGFTLIELVVVIVVLGILAAIAVPRFINLQAEARLATVDGLTGALQGASALAHAQALIDGTATGTGTIVMEGGNVDVVNGYPAGTAAGIGAALNFDGYTATYATGVATFVPDGGTGACLVTYTQAAAGPPIVPPVINNTATVANCE